jgi:hypothetical protein
MGNHSEWLSAIDLSGFTSTDVSGANRRLERLKKNGAIVHARTPPPSLNVGIDRSI